MLYILIYALNIILFIVLLLIIVLFFFWTVGNIKNKVPFVTAPKSVLESISKELNIKDGDVLYDLGSGDGRILFYIANKNPNAKFIGIENNTFPLILSKIEKFIRGEKAKNVSFVGKNFFKEDLSKATHIFTYLYPNIMDDLITKFDEELKPGTKLVSLSFQFTSKRPSKEIDLNRSKYKLGRKIYVYEF